MNYIKNHFELGIVFLFKSCNFAGQFCIRSKIYPFIQEKTVVAIADMAPVSGQEGQGRHTVPAQQVTAEMAEAGFKLDEEPTTLFAQYLLIFKKAPLKMAPFPRVIFLLTQKDKLYRCLDKLLEHKEEFFLIFYFMT